MSHAAEVAGHVAVMRHVFAQAAAHGVPVAPIAETGLGLVERWLRGEAVTQDELAAASRANHDASGRAWSSAWTDRRAWSFRVSVPSAIGNLCYFAAKLPDGATACASALDAAAAALAALEPAPEIRARVGALQHEHAAAASSPALDRLAPPRARAPARGRPRRVRADDVAPFVGELAARRLVQLGARTDPTLRGSEAELRARLAERGYPIYPDVLAFEARFGGTMFPCVAPAKLWDSQLGAYAGLASYSPPVADGRVPVARGPYDDVYFIDARGTISAHWLDRPPFEWATDLDHMAARLVLCGIHWQRLAKAKAITRAGHCGEAVARALELAPIAAATDRVGRAWGDDGALVLEHFGETLVSSHLKPRLAALTAGAS